MKKTALRKTSKAKIPTLKRKLWTLFSLYIRKRDNNTCFTCGRSGEYMQAGHFIPRSAGGIALYFHPDNVHCQCSYCNLHLQGNIYEYGKRLGQEKVDELYAIKNGAPQKWDAERYEWEIDFYKNLLAEIK
jgi:5-methylcytosine-specific restriction endonuclease McrA